MNITGEQARLIAQTDAMVQQEQGRKWAEPQVEAPDMVNEPEDSPEEEAVSVRRGAIGVEYPWAGLPRGGRINLSVDPTREGPAAHFSVERDGRVTQYVDHANVEASAEQFSGSLRQAVERATAQFNNLADVLIHTADRLR